MRKRILYGLAIVLLVLSVLLVVWQGSFHLGRFSPEGAQQALIYLATLVLIFILIVVLAFNLAREFLKLYVARQANEEGSRIRTKLVVGALTLSIVPVFFLVFFSYEVFSFNANKWFTEPAEVRKGLFIDLATSLKKEMRDRVEVQATLLALQAETRRLIEDGARSPRLSGALRQGTGSGFGGHLRPLRRRSAGLLASAPPASRAAPRSGRRSNRRLPCRAPRG